jgi:ABC-type multidrug transport system fused ATPase/permease subunit
MPILFVFSMGAGSWSRVGTHEEFVALGGMCRKMCEAQNLD